MPKQSRTRKIVDVNIYSNTGDKSLDEALLQPYKHVAQFLNKGLLRLLTTAFNSWYKLPVEKLQAIEDIFRIIYNAAALCDDIEDRSTLRRGKPVAHTIYGAANTLAAANYSFMIALEQIVDFIEAEVTENPDETIRKAVQLVVEGFRGTGLEIVWREKIICPTVEEYCQLCQIKTIGLFKLSVVLMSGASTMKEEFTKLNKLIALGVQIMNDYQNLTHEAYQNRKTFCEDITEGKCSYPIVHAIQSRPEDKRILEILRLGTTDYKVKRHCLDLIEEFGSLEATKNKIAEIRDDIMQELKKYEPNPQMVRFIEFVLGKKE